MVAKKKVKRPKRKVSKSKLTKNQFFLDPHDEEKVLLFTTGVAFGVALAAAAINAFWYTGFVIIVMLLVFWYIEQRQ